MLSVFGVADGLVAVVVAGALGATVPVLSVLDVGGEVVVVVVLGAAAGVVVVVVAGALGADVPVVPVLDAAAGVVVVVAAGTLVPTFCGARARRGGRSRRRGGTGRSVPTFLWCPCSVRRPK